MDRRKMITALALIALSIGLLVWNIEDKPQQRFFWHEGNVFGTVYHIQYEFDRDLSDTVLVCLGQVDSALSMFNPSSTIARINRNENVLTDSDFETVFLQAQEVSRLSGGAFDLTVAPLVNAWGFGFEQRQGDSEQIDSLRLLVGYSQVRLTDHRIEKNNPDILLDAGAIAKGFACDKVADKLLQAGVSNLLVEIGGEVVAVGHNSSGQPWNIGITKPIDDNTGLQQELQDRIQTDNLRLATSGNYRNFYYDGTQKRSHTIDPRTGYPVLHSLLSATVTANSCMKADALATACMVLGDTAALQLINAIPDAECYLIVASQDMFLVRTSNHWTLTR